MPVREKTLETASGKIHYWVSRAETSEKWLIFLPGLTADQRQQKALLYPKTFSDLRQQSLWDAPMGILHFPQKGEQGGLI